MKQLTEAHKESIREMWAKDMSGGEIASTLGLTRNSVIGAIYRMRKNGLNLEARKNVKKIIRKKNKEIIVRQIEIKDPDPTTIIGLTLNSCRFIIREGCVETTLYCNKKIQNRPYCKDHYKLCYRPIKK